MTHGATRNPVKIESERFYFFSGVQPSSGGVSTVSSIENTSGVRSVSATPVSSASLRTSSTSSLVSVTLRAPRFSCRYCKTRKAR